MIKSLVGVCLFDDKQTPADGWACRPDEEPVRVSGIHELSSDIAWIVNLDYKAFMAHNLGNLSHICHAQYFRQAVDFLLANYGFGSSNNKEGSRFLAKHLNLTAHTGYQLLGIDPIQSRNNYRYAQVIANNISVPIRHQPAKGLPEAQSQFIIENALQQNQIMVAPRPAKSVPMHCYFPSLTYFKWLLSQPVPVSMEWQLLARYEEGKFFGYKSGEFINYASLGKLRERCSKKGILPFFRISVVSQNKEYATFGTFGAGKQGGRSWVTLPEIFSLCRYSLIKVYEIYTLPSGFLVDDIEVLSDVVKMKDLSISHGLFMENLAAGMMMPEKRKETALAAYLRAYDRAACLVAAEKIYKAGFLVGSYSMGKIVVLGQESQRADIQRTAATLGLVPFI